MNKKRISYRLTISILSVTIIVFSIAVFLNYNFSKRILMQQIEESAINNSGLIINRISRHVVAAQEITRNVANQALYYLKHNDLDVFLENVLKSNKIINAIHVDFKPEFIVGEKGKHSVFYNKGNLEKGQTGNKCVMERHPAILNDLYKTPEGFWTEPYKCKRPESKLVISFSYPIYHPENNREIVGFVSSEIAMDYINEVVSNIKIGEQGISFIISKSGLFLTHPVREWILKKNLFELPGNILPKNINELKQVMLNGGRASGFGNPEIYNNKKAWFYFSPVPYTNWTVVILIPEKELFHDLRLVFREIIIVSAIGLILIFLLTILIFHKTLTPLVRVTEEIQKFSFGNKKTDSVKNEIISLIESLEQLQSRYSGYIEEQDRSRKDKRKFDRDMKAAKEIQLNIVPNQYPAFPDRDDLDIYAVLKPAQKIGGDLYDYFFIDKNHVLFTMGDVSGKGIPASLFMAIAHTLIKGNSEVLSTQAIVEDLNRKLCSKNTNQYFLTIFIGILDMENGILNYCNAAHNHPYVIKCDGDVFALPETHGLPLGIYPNKTYKSSSVVLKNGDALILYTDGVIDCRDQQDNTYGQQRFEDNLQNISGLGCNEMISKIEKSLQIFKGETEQADDISLMAIKYLKTRD